VLRDVTECRYSAELSKTSRCRQQRRAHHRRLVPGLKMKPCRESFGL